jgi:bla regulator protein blaR1
MSPVQVWPFANHVWQSTLFACVAALLMLALRKNGAQMRYWLWLAASVKFLIPFSLLVGLGSQVEWRRVARPAVPVAPAIQQLAQPFAPQPIWARPSPTPAASLPRVPTLVFALWLAGCAAVLIRWYLRWRKVRMAVRTASPLPLAAPIPVMSSATRMEPGVFGVFRPVLLLPEGIAQQLTTAQFQAILAHELCHARRRDNLFAALHMVVEALFWFHPLVWWLGARLVEERERACDEEVLRMGSDPEIYSEGILNVCKFYLESPLACASGVTGADLKKRIEAIMRDRISQRLTAGRKLLLAAAGMIAVAGPILIGIAGAPRSRAQSTTETLDFEVASVRPADPDARQVGFQFTPGGGLNVVNMDLKQLIAAAYGIECGKGCGDRISGGPGWINTQRFDIVAKAPPSAEANTAHLTVGQNKALQDQARLRLRTLLAERFELAIRRDSKEAPIYALVVAKGGHKLKESTGEGPGGVRGAGGEMTAERARIQLLVVNLAMIVRRPVVDQTGLAKTYDFTLKYVPELSGAGVKGPDGAGEAPVPSDPAGPSIFTALQEQLGLKLEPAKGPIETIVIERVEKPVAN